MKVFGLDLAIILRFIHGQIQLLDPLVILKRSQLALRVAALASAVGQIFDGQPARRIIRLHNRVYPRYQKKKKNRPTLLMILIFYNSLFCTSTQIHRSIRRTKSLEFTHTNRPSFPYRLSSPKISLSPNTEGRAQCHGVPTRCCRQTSLPRDITPPLENTNTRLGKQRRGYIRHGFDETRNTRRGGTRGTELKR